MIVEEEGSWIETNLPPLSRWRWAVKAAAIRAELSFLAELVFQALRFNVV